MRLARLRNQILIAMGIPACWTGSTPAPTVTPQTPVRVVSTAFDAARCPRDTVPESVCGLHRPEVRSCGAKGANLTSADESKLYITAEDSDSPAVAFRDFVFDREATHRYREGLDDQSSAPGSCCYSQCTPLSVGAADPVVTQPGFFVENKCMPAPPGGTSKPAKEDAACAIGVAFDGTLRPYASSEGGECCYSVPSRNVMIHAIPGRALRVDGAPRVAEIAERDGWGAPIRPNLDVAPDARARLGTIWLEIAQLEHASIAAFASLALRLLSVGAPADLIAAAHQAALDEIEHARIAFELASAYAGRRVGPGRFDSALRAETAGTIRELAIETFVDGCINETAAAHQADVAAAGAVDPQVAEALHRIAGDEARHAELAWAVVAWCVRSGEVSIAELREIARPVAEVAAPNNEDLAVHGVLGDRATSELRAAVMREVIEPCLSALAGGPA